MAQKPISVEAYTKHMIIFVCLLSQAQAFVGSMYYYCHVVRPQNLLGWVPLFPRFLDGYNTSTILFKYTACQNQSFNSNSGVLTVKTVKPPHHAGAAMFMRSTHGCHGGIFSWPQSQIGGHSVTKTERICRQSRSETFRGAWKTQNLTEGAAE